MQKKSSIDCIKVSDINSSDSKNWIRAGNPDIIFVLDGLISEGRNPANPTNGCSRLSSGKPPREIEEGIHLFADCDDTFCPNQRHQPFYRWTQTLTVEKLSVRLKSR